MRNICAETCTDFAINAKLIQIIGICSSLLSCSVGIPVTDSTYVPQRKDEIDCSKISDQKDSDDVVKECFSEVEFCCDKSQVRKR